VRVPGEVPEVSVLGEVPEGYGADTWLGYRGFLVQVPGEVPEVSGAAT